MHTGAANGNQLDTRGMESVFLQDANTMIVKPDDLVEILNHLKQTFPAFGVLPHARPGRS